MNIKSDTETCDPNSGCCSPNIGTTSSEEVNIVRRDFIKALGLVSGGILLGFPAFGKLFSQEEYTIPINKGLSAEWYKSLYKRGEPEIFTGKELAYVGMPIGGLFTGTVYLGGDGKLWLWDIFNENKEGIVNKTYENWKGIKQVKPRDGANFIFPVSPEYPFEQGFGIKIKQKKKTWEKSLDFKGFKDITFKGQYPTAEISYKDAELPVEIDLMAFSPFVPLEIDASSYPATVMKFTVTNKTDKKVSVELAGWLENAVLNNTANNASVQLHNSIQKETDHTVLTCAARTDSQSLKKNKDFGDMSLLLMNSGKKVKADAGSKIDSSLIFPENEKAEAFASHGEQLCGSLSQEVTLKPNQTKEVTFIISWYFPNLLLPQPKKYPSENNSRYYKKRFKNSQEVGVEIAKKYTELYSNTTSWRDTFYNDSTLPHWFLNRTFLNTSILATETCFLLEDGRFWAWEGIGCCPGTCTHVWHYAQALGRLFPELEKNLRERTDFVVVDTSSGGIPFRGRLNNKYAADGQAGIVLRAYRDYQMSTNNEFLQRNWANIKLTLQYLIDLDKEDGEANGTIFGEQHNTLDAEWYGNIPVITSLYLAALAASVEMATVMNDAAAKKEYSAILELGEKEHRETFQRAILYLTGRS